MRPKLVEATVNPIVIALDVTVLTMAMVIPAAFSVVRHKFGSKSLANVLLMLPMAVPHIMIAIGQYFYLGSISLVHSRIGVILADTSLSVPIAFADLCLQQG